MTPVALIIEVTAEHFGITPDLLVGPERTAVAVSRRAVAMQLANEMTDMSAPQIGEVFGGRDHTTVKHGLDKRLAQDFAVAKGLIREELSRQINHHPMIVRRWPFRSCRAPIQPIFQRRYTA